MYRVTRQLKFCYGHRLLNYEGKCKYVHGHNGRALLSIESETLDKRGMVVDFSDIKHSVQGWIDEKLDHQMLFHKDDPLLPIFRDHDQPVFVMEENPTAESIARLIFDYAKSQGFPVTQVHFWETDTCFATYKHGVRVSDEDLAALRAQQE